MSAQKTYSHLASARRMPTEYEIGTTKLLYYVGRGFEIDAPLGPWYQAHQSGSPLAAPDWDEFVDPRQTTYTSYVALQKDKEAHVQAVHRGIEDRESDRSLEGPWLAALERAWSPWRFAGHGLQMIAAYVGQLAPSGRITVACAFQAADEMRRVQAIAYRTAQLRLVYPTFGDGSRDLWQRDEAWQPTRRLVSLP
jgi:toluene monooxygenase system protein E